MSRDNYLQTCYSKKLNDVTSFKQVDVIILNFDHEITIIY
jgi:hypothetical protein